MSISSMPCGRAGGVWGVPVETPIVLGLPAYHTGADRADTLPDWEGKGVALTGLWH